jgi:hypothetical protein
MSPLDPAVVEVEPSGESDPQPDRRPPPYWPPRPATVVAALFVGSSLVFINLVDADFARNLSELYGWPFRFHFLTPDPSRSSWGFYFAALAADLVISAALLASACATTQVAACLLVRSPRLTVRILSLAVAAVAMLLAACRWKEDYLAYFLYTGFYYSVASLVVLATSVLLRLELPNCEDPQRRA